MEETKRQPERNDDDTQVLPQANHAPRPITPEDESYGDLMLRFTAHPVKPKYWFEEFGDHWTCSCGQINKGDTCSNCGLERDLLRKLFILHKPGADGQPKSVSEAAAELAQMNSSSSQKQASPGQSDTTEEEKDGFFSRHRRLMIGIIIALILLLLGSGAFAYFVVLPEMKAEDARQAEAVRSSLLTHLPEATAPLPGSQYRAYRAAGDMLCKKGKYHRSISYYNKAAAVKNDDSIKQKILDAKFGYVQAKQKEGGDYFETYLNELMDAGYDGVSSIYYSYYAWHMNIVANNRPEDFSTDMETLNINDTVYFHTTLTGGPPGGSVKLYYEVTWPGGNVETKEIDSSWNAGGHFTTRFQYSIPLFGKEGRLTFSLYDNSSHELLGSDSVKLKR